MFWVKVDEWRGAENDSRGRYALVALPGLRAKLARSKKACPVCPQSKKRTKKHL